jgi:glycerol-3-phosphate acyltransferase PlsY
MVCLILIYIGAMFIAYLIGAISFSYLAGKLLKGIDLRQYGSGNLGASNVFRILGRWPGLLVLMLDILKGYVAVYVAHKLGLFLGLKSLALTNLGVMAGFCAILGHIFTLYHGYRGGKGIATSLGVFIYLAPTAVAASLGIWLLVFLCTRYISLGSIIAAACLPLFVFVQKHFFLRDISGILFGFSILVSIVVILKHVSNIQRLLTGKEHKFVWK